MKSTKLLPIVALSGIATVAIPFVASCSCNNAHDPEPVEPTEFDFDLVNNSTEMEISCNSMSSSEMDVTADTEYTFKVEFSNWAYFGDSSFPRWLVVKYGVNEISEISSVYLWFNHNLWKEGQDYVITSEGPANEESWIDWETHAEEIDAQSILTGRIKVPKNQNATFLQTLGKMSY